MSSSSPSPRSPRLAAGASEAVEEACEVSVLFLVSFPLDPSDESPVSFLFNSLSWICCASSLSSVRPRFFNSLATFFFIFSFFRSSFSSTFLATCSWAKFLSSLTTSNVSRSTLITAFTGTALRSTCSIFSSTACTRSFPSNVDFSMRSWTSWVLLLCVFWAFRTLLPSSETHFRRLSKNPRASSGSFSSTASSRSPKSSRMAEEMCSMRLSSLSFSRICPRQRIAPWRRVEARRGLSR
mmetsp:Transcript_17521/g.28657  ORF Transcript_17521/g.28657 Transcript_17521/m.28657 type:complete len:239 (-) Transcript_17521:111-827(-)